jgi:peptidoglycan/LPS O-acetylase OafA/YrhL
LHGIDTQLPSTTGAPLHPRYRPDIDGLRALAVLAVVGFHAFPGWVRGGFIGVDIFLVISGYLISSIILGNLAARRFSFVDFYTRRIRRIFPALAALLLAVFAFGWFALFAGEFQRLGKHIAAGAGFIANFSFWSESGYFDAAAETKPLLHLWSLGIEEQFYLVWPLLLSATARFKINALTVIGAVFAVSLALCVYLAGHDPVAMFYSPQTRFWELASGAALAHASLHAEEYRLPRSPLAHQAMALAAAALLVASFALIDSDREFPGAWALLPVGGTVLAIAAGPRTWLAKLFALRLPVFFGKISYPLYLWHWPFLAAIYIVWAEYTPSVQRRAAALALAFLCAWLTYALIERPLRFGPHGSAKALALLLGMVAVGGAGFAGWRNGGFEGTGFRTADREAFAEWFDYIYPASKYYHRIDLYDVHRGECSFFDERAFLAGHRSEIPLPSIAPACYVRDPAKPHAVLVWGDSHAQQLWFGLRSEMPKDWQLLQVASPGCKPVLDMRGPSGNDICTQSNWFAQKTIAEAKPDVVVVARERGHDPAAMAAMAERLHALGAKKVLFTGPTPHWTAELPNIVVRRLWADTPRRTLASVDEDFLARDRALKAGFVAMPYARYVDIIDRFCDAEGCLVYLGEDKQAGLTSYDRTHLTTAASDYFAKTALVPAILGD